MSVERVKVETPCRLHFALIDLNGELGRVDGGAGVALEKPNTKIIVETIDEINAHEIIGTSEERKKQIERVLSSFKGFFRVEVKKEIPAHIGFGSTTQLLLAVARACEELNGGKRSVRELAELVGRGGTSGIGVKAFESGGFIVDAGHSFGKGREKESFLPSSASRAPPPEIIFCSELPREWLFACVIPEQKEKIHGRREVDIFQKHCPIARSEVEKTRGIVFLKMVPSVVEKDAASFGESLNLLQGCGFKKIEWEYQASGTREAHARLKQACFGAGLSSFGPLVFGLTDKNKIARRMESEFENCFVAKASGKGATFTPCKLASFR